MIISADCQNISELNKLRQVTVINKEIWIKTSEEEVKPI